MDNAKIYIDQSIQSTQIDNYQVGEILIGGNGVAKEYVNNHKLTAEKFVCLNNEKYYRTGDIGYFREDGNLIYLGRIDNQIQINGIRVELGEIETQIINTINDIEMAKVLYNQRKLYCFYRTKNRTDIDRKFIKESIKEVLPQYMIPSIYIRVDEFPFTQNGKMDTKKLLEMCDRTERNINSVKKNEEKIKSKVRSIFAEVLNIDGELIDDHSDFFYDLGGDSLSAISATVMLERSYGVSLEDNFIYSNSTIFDITDWIKNNSYMSKTEINNQQEYAKKIGDFEKQLIKDTLNQYEKYLKLIKHSLKEKDRYKCYRYQDNYYANGFESILSFTIDINDAEHELNLRKSFTDLINNNELLRSVISKIETNLYFVEYDKHDFNLIPTIVLDKKYEKNIIVDFLDNISEKSLKNNILDNFLFRSCIVLNGNKKFFYFGISHYISDLYSVQLMKRELLSVSKIKNNLPKLKYKEYIDLVTKSELNVFRNTLFFKRLLKVDRVNIPLIEDEVIYVIEVEKNQKVDYNSSKEIIVYANYIISKIIKE
ncbi:non-ribosomal peptide synthetase, partial [Weizmannia acidilactici]|uniref:non-ribosomal peptide synthetase n=3 Tax=Weizmannia acidilactici TaxID=2607726 RepID=UPI00124BF5F2